MGLLEDKLKETQDQAAKYLDLMQQIDAISFNVHQENRRLKFENEHLKDLIRNINGIIK